MNVKKLLVFATALITVLTLLASCGGGDPLPNDSEKGDDNVIFSPDYIPTVVVGEAEYGEFSGTIVNAITKLTGKMPRVVNGTSEPTEREIVIGSTERLVSKQAMSHLAADVDANARLGGYVIYSEGKSVAIVATHADAMEKAVDDFVLKYMSSDTLSAKTQIYDAVTILPQPVDQAAWEARFDVYSPTLNADAINSLKAIYSMFNDDTLFWMANLWEPFNCTCGGCDPDSGEPACFGGGFYYANSARDYFGFLPDIESTTQMLGLLSGSGLTSAYGGDLKIALPQKMQDAMVKFVQATQSPTDKFFYHPQWGTSINSSRRGRDFDSGMGILNRFGAKPPYGSPIAASCTLENAKNLTRPLGNSPVSAVSAVVSTASLPSYLQSESAFGEWLEALNINEAGKSYSAGHTISSIRTQIKAARLDGFCIEWLNSKQLDNGLWEEGEVTYSKTNGLLKISTMYDSWGVPFPRIEHGINAFIDMLYSESPVTQITDIYNIWVGLSILMSNAKKNSVYLYDDIHTELLSDAKNIFDLTSKKLAVFYKDDGSFSYFPNASAKHSQGELASLGLNEGDVNATALATGTVSRMLASMGLPTVAFYNNDQFDTFMSIIDSLSPVEKIMVEGTKIDFNDSDVGDTTLPTDVSYSQLGGTGEGRIDVLAKDSDSSDRYIVVTSKPGAGDQLKVEAPTIGMASCFFLDTEVRFDGGGIQIFLGSAVMLTVNASGDNIVLKDANKRSGADHHTTVATVKRGEWVHLRIEYFPDAGRIIYYVNDACVAVSNNYIGYSPSGNGKDPISEFNYVEYYATIGSDTSFAIDNILVDRSTKKYVKPDGFDEPSDGTEQGGNQDGGEKPTAPDTGEVTLPLGIGGGRYFKEYHGIDYSEGLLNESDFWVNGASTKLNGNPTANAEAYARVVKYASDSALEFAKLTDTVNERHVGWRATGSGDVYVFETDFLFDKCTLDNADPWPIRFAVQDATSSTTSPKRIISLILRIDKATGNLKHNETGTVITKGEWHNVAIKYNKTTGAYEYLLDGVVFYSGTAAVGVNVRGVSAELRAYSSDHVVYFDNTYSGFVSE